MATAAGTPRGAVRIGRAVIDLDAGRVVDPAGQAAALRPQAFAVLRHLIANPGRLVTKDELMEAVWPGIAVTDDSLVQCVGEIRKALGDEGRTLVETVPRRGYRLAVGPEGQGDAAARGARRAAILAAAAVVAALAVGAWRMFGDDPVATRTPVVAVLPFTSMAGEARDYLGPGVAENVITMLARSPDVVVIARGSAFAHGDGPRDARAVGAALGADYVLEGSVRREGDKLRVTAQLEDARSGRSVWAERFERVGPDPWALIDEVSDKILGAVAGEGGQLRLAQFRDAWGKDSTSLGEYDYFLRGLDVYYNAETAEENARGGRIWEEGLARYPDSALLAVKLAWYHWTAAWDFWDGDIAWHYAEADRLVSGALARDDLTPETQRVAHWLNAMVLMQKGAFDAAVGEAELTIAMAPYDGHVLRYLTNVLIADGRYEMALDWLDRAELREPRMERVYAQMRHWIYRLMGRYEESAAALAGIENLSPYNKLSLAIALVRLGRIEEAKAYVRQAQAEYPQLTRSVWREGSFYSDPAVLDAEVAALAQAGLPES
ncbi:winged helix-turn-helix domain-containing protein [Amaricoccus sp.]|uniref:winged helix-turn-helix domain-containing protein n=1 Tax=Amaricoccus sp. TaxID=1872485 RepID=UPI001B4D9591|nr:winged helix-turn-helix domain-containing protein [Amaricoccus sp.]MBP7000893.1 winged helix-turn-helix domain-containing protein [Amaricoccus sp.]